MLVQPFFLNSIITANINPAINSIIIRINRVSLSLFYSEKGSETVKTAGFRELAVNGWFYQWNLLREINVSEK